MCSSDLADLALTGPQGLTPALTAVANGFPVAAHMFLPQGETLLNQLRNFLENNPQPIAQQRRLLNSLLAGFCCLPEPEAVKLLCAAGAFARFAPDGDGRLTPVISWAVQAGQKDVVATLLELGADARQFNKDMNTPLHFAAAAGSVEIARMLLDAGAAVNDRNKEWQTPLHNACREHEFEMIEELLSRGADANTVGKEMETPLHLLVWRSPCHEHEGVRRFTKALECLLEHGEDINAQDIEGNTPLNLVAGWVQFPQDEDAITVAAKLMLENGASVAAANKDGLTPCHTASMMNCPLIARMLITRGADINARDNEGRTPLCWVFKFVMVLAHFADTVDTLIGAGGDIESRDNDGLTILDRAARETYHFIVPYLISKGASPTSVGPDGKTALHHASLGGQDQAAEALLNAGADIALRDGQLMTPVLYALAAGSKEVLAILDPDATRRYSDLEYLIANNGNLDAKAMAGRQMIHGAARLGDVKAIEILLQAGVGVYEMPDYGRPALFHACETNATVAVEALIKAGADVNLECSGVTPLHSAVSAWSLESIQILIKAGADKTAKDNNRKTAFDLAKDLPPDIRELLKP